MGKAGVAFPIIFLRRGSKNGRKELEAEADAHLDRPRGVHLRIQDTKSLRRRQAEGGVGKLVMVENVREDGLEFSAEAFVDVNVLLDLEVHVPEGHPAKHAPPAGAAVQTKNRVVHAVEYGLGICEEIHIAGSSNAARARNVVMA